MVLDDEKFVLVCRGGDGAVLCAHPVQNRMLNQHTSLCSLAGDRCRSVEDGHEIGRARTAFCVRESKPKYNKRILFCETRYESPAEVVLYHFRDGFHPNKDKYHM